MVGAVTEVFDKVEEQFSERYIVNRLSERFTEDHLRKPKNATLLHHKMKDKEEANKSPAGGRHIKS